MSIGSWTLFVILAAVAFAAAFFIYVRREPPGRGRAVLALLRGAALSLILLLLFDPELSRPLGRAAEPAVLIDGSLSMRASAGTGPDTSRTVWDAAVEAARSAGTPRAFVFGDEVVVVSGDSLARLRPTTPDSRVVPALRAAVEAGATRALVLTDGRINDIAGAERLAREAGVVVEWRRLGPRLGNLALGELDAPVWAEAGEPITFRIGVLAADTTAGDSLGVSLLQDGRVLDRTRVAIAGAGRVAVATLEAPATAPDGGGLVRYDVALDPGDAVADDDRRSVYVYVADEPAGVVLVSFRPDWEPRFLLPALEEALGVPARGYLRLDDRWVATGRALDAGSNVDEGAVRRAAERADLLVLQAPSAELPAWARSLADSATRVIHLPAATSATEGLPIGLGPALPGEWYIAPAIPASPVAPQLAGLAVDSLPPLLGLRSAPQLGSSWAALAARRGRSGELLAALVGGETGGRRWLVATGQGYWRWAFRGGEPRRTYRALWSAAAGWLMRDERGIAPLAVRPLSWVAPRARAVGWVAPGTRLDSIALRLERDGAPSLDTTLVAQDDTAWLSGVAPGHYQYRARAFAGGQVAAVAVGPVSVESYTADFARATVEWPDIRGDGARPADAGRLRRPLRTSAWPYVAVIMVLCAEWVLRRRWGLR